MSRFHEHFFVITGSPGSGKSTLLQSLEDRAWSIMPESGRAIIKDQLAIQGKALPWEDKSTYAELMLSWDIRSWREAPRHNRPVLFDRGIPDIIGYLTLCGIPVPLHLLNAANHYRYHKKVFIAPYWPEIYARDNERKQSAKEARATFDIMMLTYSMLGYEPIVLPMDNLEARTRFIMDQIGSIR